MAGCRIRSIGDAARLTAPMRHEPEDVLSARLVMTNELDSTMPADMELLECDAPAPAADGSRVGTAPAPEPSAPGPDELKKDAVAGGSLSTLGDLDTARPSIAETAKTSGGEGNAPPTPEYEVIAGYKVHPLLSTWPLMAGKAFDDLVEAAARSRRLYPAETNGGLLIEGRNRLRAQEELRRRGIEIEVPVVEWEPTGDETVAEHIWSVNANRRHQTPDQLTVNFVTNFLPAIKAEREARQKASRFGHNGKGTAASNSTPPDGEVVKPGRTSAEKDAASTAGGVARSAGVTIYKARQGIKFKKAVEAGEVSEDDIAAVKAGEKPMSAVLPQLRAANARRQAATRFGGENTVNGNSDSPAAGLGRSPSPPASGPGTTTEQLAAVAGVSLHKARNAIALCDAVEAGEVPREEMTLVEQGNKPLRDAVPPSRKRKAKKPCTTPPGRPPASKATRTVPPGVAAEDDADAPAPTPEEINRRWERFKDGFAIADHRVVRAHLLKKITEEQAAFDS